MQKQNTKDAGTIASLNVFRIFYVFRRRHQCQSRLWDHECDELSSCAVAGLAGQCRFPGASALRFPRALRAHYPSSGPTAAAIAYGLGKKTEKNILVYELSLLTVDNGDFEVIR